MTSRPRHGSQRRPARRRPADECLHDFAGLEQQRHVGRTGDRAQTGPNGPSSPTISVAENPDSNDSFVNGTTYYYRPGSVGGATFRVIATTTTQAPASVRHVPRPGQSLLATTSTNDGANALSAGLPLDEWRLRQRRRTSPRRTGMRTPRERHVHADVRLRRSDKLPHGERGHESGPRTSVTHRRWQPPLLLQPHRDG